ncbi:MAG: hypothetical protein ABR511_01340 [Acidimicrobiales bacterium]
MFGDKGRPELGTGVLERVMRQMDRRNDVAVRCSVAGVLAMPPGSMAIVIRIACRSAE